MNSRKKIALLCSQINEKYQKQFIEGFLKKSFDKDYDVCIFSSFIKEPETNLKEIGECNIFSLVNYNLFDAVVVLPDILQVSGLMMRIEEDLKNKFSGKVLYVDKPSTIYPYIMIDHYTPFIKLMNHLIDDHGYRDIAFINGYKFHPHSIQRYDAYVDSLKNHGIDFDENRIYYGNYWFDSGSNIIKEIISKNEIMPEAFICANDYMALGISEEIVKSGYRVPDDVAVVGYDLVDAGQKCPEPITSVELPTTEFGEYAASCIDNLINNIDFSKFTNNSAITFGSSCGCKLKQDYKKSADERQWNTYFDKTVLYFSSFNQFTEDLVLQPTFKNLIDLIQTYTYQIREFDSFTICLNDVWVQDCSIENTVIKSGYTKEMVPILHCGPSGKGADKIDFDARFDTSLMFPELYDDCEHPRAFIFSPLYYEDITFGYGVLSYGDKPQSYTDAYYRWMKSVMLGIECSRRNSYLIQAKQAAEDVQIYDPLTGMLNYIGFVKHSNPMIDRAYSAGFFISVLVIELDNLDYINSSFGRKEGEIAITQLSNVIFESANEGSMCVKLSNDEFMIVDLLTDANLSKVLEIQRKIDNGIDLFNSKLKDYDLLLYFGYDIAAITNLNQMEDLINQAVSQKNGNKANALKLRNNAKLTNEELKQAELVRKILNENLFFYNFQPIVSAKDGSIYAYEALMRSSTEVFVSPADIIKYANHYNRLIDVEKATFFNVLDYIENNPEKFGDRKVFINSIPGNQIVGEEAEFIGKRLKNRKGQVVVELTEQTEADDLSLSQMKNKYQELDVETAVDDYGTGYSSIVNLLRYMPDYVKIDRMLLSDIHESPQKQHFVKDIVLFAHENNFKVLAEGIEKIEELEAVIDLNVDLIQGYYTAKPSKVVIDAIPIEISEQIKQFASKKNN